MTDARELELARRRMRAIRVGIDAQLRSGQDVIRIADLGLVGPEYAWALARTIDAALDHGGTYQPPSRDALGQWWALIDVPLGRWEG